MDEDPPLTDGLAGSVDGTDPDGSDGPHAFVIDVESPELSEADRHHLARVVRLRDGDPLTIGDGRGSWRTARFGAILEVTGPIIRVAAPVAPITVGFALLKGSRIDDVTRHLTELGVDVIVPFLAQRSVVRWDDHNRDKRHARLVRISVEAAMQCRRAWLPSVEPLRTFADLAAREGMTVAQMGAPPLNPEVRGLIVGPEGGFTSEELASGRASASLGRHVLRAETAALAAGTLLADRRDRTR